MNSPLLSRDDALSAVLRLAARAVCSGGVIAYPTEAVYGLGCNPWNRTAVERILELKGRPADKGLIVVGASVQQLSLLTTLDVEQIESLFPNTIEQPVSWAIPAHPQVPEWITGVHSTVVLRLIRHCVASQLCLLSDTPLVSTSANRAGEAPASTSDAVRAVFRDDIDVIVDSPIGGAKKPSIIRDWASEAVLRG